MKYLFLLIKIIPIIKDAIELAEGLFKEPGMGTDKKAFVINFIRSTISNLVGISTGGQKETWAIINEAWQQLEGVISGLIDLFASVMFPKD